MSYHGLGAGPGPTETYYVDMPFPWGDDTELKLPMAELMYDATQAIPYDILMNNAFNAIPMDRVNAIVDDAVDSGVNRATPQVIRRIELALPDYISQVRPQVDEVVNTALAKAFVGGTVLLGGFGYIMWRLGRGR